MNPAASSPRRPATPLPDGRQPLSSPAPPPHTRPPAMQPGHGGRAGQAGQAGQTARRERGRGRGRPRGGAPQQDMRVMSPGGGQQPGSRRRVATHHQLAAHQMQWGRAIYEQAAKSISSLLPQYY